MNSAGGLGGGDVGDVEAPNDADDPPVADATAESWCSSTTITAYGLEMGVLASVLILKIDSSARSNTSVLNAKTPTLAFLEVSPSSSKISISKLPSSSEKAEYGHVISDPVAVTSAMF